MPSSATVVTHALHHESMESITRPSVVGSKRLEHQKGFAQLDRAVDRVLKREVVLRPTKGGHPIKDIIAIASHGTIVRIRDSQGWDSHGCDAVARSENLESLGSIL